jgi:hypothetical protein
MVCASVRPPPSLAKTVEVVLSSADGTAMGKLPWLYVHVTSICGSYCHYKLNLALCLTANQDGFETNKIIISFL